MSDWIAIVLLFAVFVFGPAALAIARWHWREWRHPYDPYARDRHFCRMKGMDR